MWKSTKVTGALRGPIKNTCTMSHTITLTPEEIELVYFALNDYSLKYMHASTTFARTATQKDYAHEKAEAVTRLQIRVGDEMFNTNNTR